MIETIKKHFKKIIVALLGIFTLTAAAATTLMVPQGGTGASTLTGVVVGNGTGAFTTNSTGALASDLNFDSDTFVISYDDNKVGLGTTTPAYKLDVVGSIQTDTAFRGDYWISATGNSMYVQPTGDTDDFFSFKTPADRPTIKREGGKYIYVESSNVNDVGISFRKDADHSGTVNYYKDTIEFGLTSKDPLVFKASDDYDDYLKIVTASNVPEMTIVGAADLKINAGGANNLLLNHSGGRVGIGTVSPNSALEVNGTITAPTLIGGTTTTSDLTLQTTSGVGTTGADMHFKVGNNGATEAMTILNNGNVGIGTNAPNANLTIKGILSNDDKYLSLFDGANEKFSIEKYATNYVEINTDNNLYFNVASASGSVIYKTTGGMTFQLEGGTGTNTFRSWGGHLDFKTSGGAYDLSFSPNDVEAVRIKDGGNVGIGTTTPSTKLDVNGTATATSFVGPLTGNSSTATALAANGANCSAGQYPLGVDASGAVESCTNVNTVWLTNKSGGSLAANDTVVIDNSNTSAVTTTTTAGNKLAIGVIKTGGADNAQVEVQIAGLVSVKIAGVVPGSGYFLRTATTAKYVYASGTVGATGDFLISLSGGNAGMTIPAIFKRAELN